MRYKYRFKLYTEVLMQICFRASIVQWLNEDSKPKTGGL
jgi:hypothetical protein